MLKQSRSITLFVLLLAAALLLAACPASQPAAPSGGAGEAASAPEAAPAAEATHAPEAEAPPAADSANKQIIYALYQEPEILNPYIATQTAAGEVSTFIIEGLLSVDPDGNRYPVLAKEVPTIAGGLVSEDGLTVKYNLRDDVLWSDGEPFTCDDVLFTYEAVTDPASGAVSTTGYDKIESVTCDSDYAVTIQFNEFYAPYLALFSDIMPRHATGETADMQNWEYNWNPVGTGPFMQKEWENGDHITLVANPNYRDYPEKPIVPQVIIRIIPSREVGKALITSGEIDILWDLTEADVPEFEANPSVVVNKRPSPGTERLVLNLADPTLDATDDPLNHPHPILGDLRVRRAIQYGIDKQFLVDELLFGATTVGVSELSIGWAKCDIPTAEYSPEKAMALLEDAGWTDGDGDGIRECTSCEGAEAGTALSLKLQTTTGNQLREETEQLLIEMMRDIGVDFYIENVPSAELFGSWSSGAFRKHGNFDIVMYTTSDGLDPQSQMYGYFHSASIPVEANAGAGFNYSRWINAAADAAVDAAGSSPDEAVRKANYQIACEQVDAELPHIYLYDRSEVHLSRSNVVNFLINPWGGHAWNAQDWDIQ